MDVQLGRPVLLPALASSSTIAADAAIASADATVAADVAARDIQFQEQPARRARRVVRQPGERRGGLRPHLGVGHGRRDRHVEPRVQRPMPLLLQRSHRLLGRRASHEHVQHVRGTLWPLPHRATAHKPPASPAARRLCTHARLSIARLPLSAPGRPTGRAPPALTSSWTGTSRKSRTWKTCSMYARAAAPLRHRTPASHLACSPAPLHRTPEHSSPPPPRSPPGSSPPASTSPWTGTSRTSRTCNTCSRYVRAASAAPLRNRTQASRLAYSPPPQPTLA